MISRALRKLFEIDFGYRDVTSVTSCSAVLKMLKKGRYSHLIIDIGLTDGSALEILPVIRNLYPDLRIMVYSARPSGVYVRGLQKYGIYHYLSKETGELDSIRCFRSFLGDAGDDQPGALGGAGGIGGGADCRGGWEDTGKTAAADGSPFSTLTDRQLQVMHYLLNGFSGIEIAVALNVKANTISTIKGQVFERTGTKNMMELAELAGLYGVM